MVRHEDLAPLKGRRRHPRDRAGGLSTALNDDTLTSAEASTILIAFVTAAGTTWAAPNRDKAEA